MKIALTALFTTPLNFVIFMLTNIPNCTKHLILPILKIETDATAQCGGQILTRLEAFLESLRAQKGEF